MDRPRPATPTKPLIKGAGSLSCSTLAGSLSSSRDNLTTHTPEVWQQVDKLRKENDRMTLESKQRELELQRMRTLGVGISLPSSSGDDVFFHEQDESTTGKWWKRNRKLLWMTLAGIPLLLLFVAALICSGMWIGTNIRNRSVDLHNYMAPLPISAKQRGRKPGVAQGLVPYGKPYINLGQRNDFKLQECQGPEFKTSFPDLDYAFLGYNILKGYPLAVGHDPGFTLPIFAADYSEARQTADCRYSVPRGVLVIPDVSCVLSFSSKVIQTRYEFAHSLSAAAEVSGGGWGVSFSASAGYKQTSSTISTGQFAYILSTASCSYYFSELITIDPPPLHQSFVRWVRKLDAEPDNEDLFLEFLDTYGTHYASKVTFGARYTQESKMESKKMETMQSNGVNVGVAASYAGIASAGGGFNMDTEQREAASEFEKSVEKKTITVGAAPPASGDAQKWAATVQESPVPTKYDLVSIEKIFNAQMMAGLDVDYERIQKKIGSDQLKMKYCNKFHSDGQVDSCEELSPGLRLEGTKLHGHYQSFAADQTTCIEECMDRVNCVAVSYCSDCSDKFQRGRCYLYQENKNTKKMGTYASGWTSILFLPKISSSFKLVETEVEGNDRSKKNASVYQDCWRCCHEDEQCVAFEFCHGCSSRNKNCKLFSEASITGLEAPSSVAKSSGVYFISRLIDPPTTTTTTTTTTTPAPIRRHG